MTEFEDSECKKLGKQYRLHLEDANFAIGYIPRKILLDRTRNIHSYFVFCKYENGVLESAYWNKDNFTKSIKSMIALQYSDLDRPLFFVFQDHDKYKAIEGCELREAILEKPTMNITQYILDNSYNLVSLLIEVKKEL